MVVHVSDILFAEDNPADAKLTMLALKDSRLSNSITHVHDGEEVLDYIYCEGRFAFRNIEDNPVLILLDLYMPKLNGIEVIEKIKSDERTKMIPLVVFTHTMEAPEISKCRELGVNSYIVKPLQADSLKKVAVELGLCWVLINLN